MNFELRLIKIVAGVSNCFLNGALRLLQRREKQAYAKHRKHETILSSIGKTGLTNAHQALTLSIAADDKLGLEIRRINSLTNTIQNLQEDFSSVLEATNSF